MSGAPGSDFIPVHQKGRTLHEGFYAISGGRFHEGYRSVKNRGFQGRVRFEGGFRTEMNDGIDPFYRLFQAKVILKVPGQHFDFGVSDHAPILQQVTNHEPRPAIFQHQTP